MYDYIHPFPVVDETTGVAQPSRTDGVLYDLAGTVHAVTNLMDQPSTVSTTAHGRLVPFRADIEIGVVRFGSGQASADPGTTVYSAQALNSRAVAEAAQALATNAQALAQEASSEAAQSAAAAQAAQVAAEAAGTTGSSGLTITGPDSDGAYEVSVAPGGTATMSIDNDGAIVLTI